MKVNGLLFVLVAVVLHSCMWGVPKKTSNAKAMDTLAYTYKIVKDRSAACGNAPDSTCTSAIIKYPEFANSPILNDTVNKKLVRLFATSKNATTLPAIAKSVITMHDSDKTGLKANYTMNVRAKVVRQDSLLTTLQIDGYTYLGGAHGSTLTEFVNWDTKTKKAVMLDDILSNKDSLTIIAEKIFRIQEKLSDTESLKTNYFFKEGKFALNHNFLISPLGIRFLYNQYEIKPYAAGQTDLLIPYNQIKTLLKPNTVVSQYLAHAGF